uniref:Uncharacterized protein n=1 Tax=Glossina brevipalpis TaxID=37001 RepID=A0A1A9WBN5_9MUSC
MNILYISRIWNEAPFLLNGFENKRNRFPSQRARMHSNGEFSMVLREASTIYGWGLLRLRSVQLHALRVFDKVQNIDNLTRSLVCPIALIRQIIIFTAFLFMPVKVFIITAFCISTIVYSYQLGSCGHNSSSCVDIDFDRRRNCNLLQFPHLHVHRNLLLLL